MNVAALRDVRSVAAILLFSCAGALPARAQEVDVPADLQVTLLARLRGGDADADQPEADLAEYGLDDRGDARRQARLDDQPRLVVLCCGGMGRLRLVGHHLVTKKSGPPEGPTLTNLIWL